MRRALIWFFWILICGGGQSGFDVLPLLHGNAGIVFVTSHDEYAIQAFEWNALHYLLKPATLPQLREVLARMPDTARDEDKPFLLKDRKRQRVVREGDIMAIQAAGDYTHVHIRREDIYEVHKTMKEWGEELSGKAFIRLDRSLIVRCADVNGVEFGNDGDACTLILRHAPPLKVGKTAAHAAERLLQERSP